MTAHKIPSLDGLRALSITLVILGHTYNGIVGQAPDTPIWLVIGNGGLGVSIFFVLSGFLISGLLIKEWERDQKINILEFYRRRAYRIFPAFYTYLAVVTALGMIGVISLTKSDFFSAFFYVWNYSPTATSWTLEHTWSLSVEEQFYLLWPTLLLFALRFGGKELAARFALALIAISPLIRVVTYATHTKYGAVHMPFMLHTRMDGLMFGCFVALTWGTPFWERAYETAKPVILLFPAFLFIASPLLRQHFGGAYLYLAGYSMEGFCIALIMTWIIRHPASAAGRLLNSRLAVHVGVISYSLYLWQHIFLHQEDHSVLGQFPVSLVATLVSAEASYWLVERTFLRLRDRRGIQRTKEASHAAI